MNRKYTFGLFMNEDVFGVKVMDTVFWLCALQHKFNIK